jgi:uncharacterized membrane protein YidH (DUF202 family)
MLPGNQINKNIQVTIPQNAARTSMIATVAENVTMHVFIIYGQYSINSSVKLQGAPDVTSSSDEAITPLTYIMATTPEYTTLQNQFQALQSQYTQGQQTLAQTRAQLETEEVQLSQRNATIIQLNKQFNEQMNEQMIYANRRIQTYQGLSLVLGFTTAALAFLCVYQRITMPRESEALVESIAVAKSKQMSDADAIESKQMSDADAIESKQMSDADAIESEPKRRSNLKKISIAAMVILVIVISAWMAAAYYYGNASTVVVQTNTSSTVTSQTYTTGHSSTSTGVHASVTTGTRTSTTIAHSSTTTTVQTSVTTKT